jgi:FeS assembly SUF system protein
MSFRQWLSKAEQAEAERLPPRSELESDIIFVLRTIYDPEIPVNIYDLGLIYGLDANPENGQVHLRMTLTAPGCPVAQSFPEMVADAVRQVPGVEDVQLELVWEPPWSKKMMSEAARLELGLV